MSRISGGRRIFENLCALIFGALIGAFFNGDDINSGNKFTGCSTVGFSSEKKIDGNEKNPIINVYFTPGDECTSIIIKELGKAKTKILVQAYSFTSKEILNALIEAVNRGVKVRVILDNSNRTAKHTVYKDILDSRVKVYIDKANGGIAHNKVMIIDDNVVITGSFNFTYNAQYKNAENILVVCDNSINEKYKRNWKKRKCASEKMSMIN